MNSSRADLIRMVAKKIGHITAAGVTGAAALHAYKAVTHKPYWKKKDMEKEAEAKKEKKPPLIHPAFAIPAAASLGAVGAGQIAKEYGRYKLGPAAIKFMRAMEGKEGVEDPKAYVRAEMRKRGLTRTRPFTVVSTHEDARAASQLKDIPWHHKGLLQNVSKDLEPRDAAVLRGPNRDVIMIGKNTPKDVIHHEIGHIIGAHQPSRTSLLHSVVTRGFLSGLHPKLYKRYLVRPEVEAHRLGQSGPGSSSKPSATRGEIRSAALGTYKKAYPIFLGSSLKTLGALGLLGTGAGVGVSHLVRKLRERRAAREK